MCGGEQAPFDKAKPVAMSYAKAITLIGPPGSGQITKMMNQMCIAGSSRPVRGAQPRPARRARHGQGYVRHLQGLRRQSWQMDNRWQTWSPESSTTASAVNWMRKDLGIAMAEGKRWNAQMPVVAWSTSSTSASRSAAAGRWDT
jgi:3-hydroxyisobutyrate dehydrogenase-like beta-hydroxyacid dehydrogenase